MRIDSSTVAMQSSRSYHAVEEKNSVSVSSREGSTAAIVSFSAQSRERLEQMNGEQQEIHEKQQDKDNKKEQLAQTLAAAQTAGAGQTAQTTQTAQVSNESDLKLQILRSMIEMLKRLQMLNAKKGKPVDLSQIKRLEQQYKRARQQMSMTAGIAIASGTGSIPVSGGGQSSGRSTTWHRTTMESVFMQETENTAYSAQGIVRTADGREIGFHVDVEMSRSFCAQYEHITQEDYIVTDPLVINLDTDVVNVTDQKFLFDIDSDGKEDELSFVGQGSGFLALDKNGDGKINNGSELFGTRSGNGFKDLAAYDKDGNGWIDEADDIFRHLKIWTKDEDGNDKLLDLKEAGVGALYLGSAATQFSLNDTDTNETNALIRRTGVYLKESGEAGTMQHVDLVL